MDRKFFCRLISVLLVSPLVCGMVSTEISYTVTNLDSDQWRYTYWVTNLSLLTPILEFSIWFDSDLYKDLSIVTSVPIANEWDEMLCGLNNEVYDALAIRHGIAPSETVSGFSVNFTWLGEGTPGSQCYEIINPSDFSTIDSGFTVPEPATLCIFSIGGVLLLKRKR